ncbi:hypothetical protein EIK77_003173 [Talaromyces pinophilus]|nr:hypothetical protein EIK77_003173 [Talaromyces pinophilus]PCH00787.1 Glycoside hydrolase family 3 [Penicillium occitanis (nom. inval.)]PCH01440.1 hypothetical protein PENOC_048390 [Penicillium occitanis (nom. inval.)]
MSSHPDDKFSLPYWNRSLPIDDRVQDLIQRMNISEKAGLLFQDKISMKPNGEFDDERRSVATTEELVTKRMMNHFNFVGSIKDARVHARWHNRIQSLARTTRLGIPVTISTDPRNHFTDNIGTSAMAGAFSQWPEPLGFAALRNAKLVHEFADIIRQEYLATGFRLALHPQVDLATEPRWARVSGGFGEDADLTSQLVTTYIKGLQGVSLGPQSVSAMTKHFPGGGPQKDGEDPHFTYGKDQVYDGNNMEYHLKPFRAAITAGTSQIMPYYGQPIRTKYEEVGFAFNKQIITELLREELGFQGIVCTDWGLITDSMIMGQDMPARCWGLEHLSRTDRVQRLLESGCDMMGGESCPELVVQLVEEGRISESRVDISVERVLREKFVLGLFDNPFVDIDAAAQIAGCESFRAKANQAQRQSYTLLKNDRNILPLLSIKDKQIYVEGIDPSMIKARGGIVVDNPETAEIAFLRLKAPYEPRPGGFEALFHAGSLEFSPKEKSRQGAIFKTVPIVVVDLYLDRPATIPEIAGAVSALLVNYGSSPEAFLDVIFGDAEPTGLLPFDLPSSMDAVRASRSDVPYDTKDPLFRFGDGLRYAQIKLE